ncbi:hypothetical protein ONZ43_g2713 [Nemania bipapillata]|uniref:Uncharacterized protein n=1 Tax=Nemania bipapillata TaxID=110536 RepID=A0ACC2IZJ2_9PEZI|nr:hypothetical protein ONZ43_g2713 [Nemania bipapillata]
MIRFELAWQAAIDTSLTVFSPWRKPKLFEALDGQAALLAFAAKHNIPEKSELEPPADLCTSTIAPDEPLKFSIHFKKRIPVKLEVGSETITGSLELFKAASRIGYNHGVGRIDIVESRFIGLKSRGRNVRRLRDQFVATEWSRCLYNGMYFSPEREFLENSVTSSQKGVNGKANMMVYKGSAYVIGRSSETSNLYSETEASMDSLEGFSPIGYFVSLSGRLKTYGAQKIIDDEPLIRN